MTTARELVTKRLTQRARQYPDFEPVALDVSDLGDPRDAALASAIDHAVARRWPTLATVIEHVLSRRWEELEPPLQAVLLGAAAQVLLLDRIPDHAAINDAVDLAKRLVRPGAGGLVNAVLRRVSALRGERVDTWDLARRDEFPLSGGGAIRLTEDVFDADADWRLACQTGHAESLLAAWRAAYGRDQATDIARHSLVEPPIIVTGLDAPGHDCRPHAEPGFQVFEGRRDELDTLLSGSAAARVQDPTAALPVLATSDLAPAMIIDACAGLGTKTRQLASVHPEARIVATDVSERRLATLTASFSGHERVTVVAFDRLEDFRGEADLLVLDVPCTNTGVLARRVEAKYRYTDERLQSLVDVQRQIVADTLPLLGDNGVILYTTCSIDPAETTSQAEWITRWHPMKVVASEARLPEGAPGGPPDRYHDGGSYALLRRT